MSSSPTNSELYLGGRRVVDGYPPPTQPVQYFTSPAATATAAAPSSPRYAAGAASAAAAPPPPQQQQQQQQLYAASSDPDGSTVTVTGPMYVGGAPAEMRIHHGGSEVVVSAGHPPQTAAAGPPLPLQPAAAATTAAAAPPSALPPSPAGAWVLNGAAPASFPQFVSPEAGATYVSHHGLPAAVAAAPPQPPHPQAVQHQPRVRHPLWHEVTLFKMIHEGMGTTWVDEREGEASEEAEQASYGGVSVSGVYLSNVAENSAAHRCGVALHLGQRLTHINNVPVATVQDALSLRSSGVDVQHGTQALLLRFAAEKPAAHLVGLLDPAHVHAVQTAPSVQQQQQSHPPQQALQQIQPYQQQPQPQLPSPLVQTVSAATDQLSFAAGASPRASPVLFAPAGTFDIRPEDVMVEKAVGEMLGCVFNELVLVNVSANSPASRHDLERFLGCRLTHINGKPVTARESLTAITEAQIFWLRFEAQPSTPTMAGASVPAQQQPPSAVAPASLLASPVAPLSQPELVTLGPSPDLSASFVSTEQPAPQQQQQWLSASQRAAGGGEPVLPQPPGSEPPKRLSVLEYLAGCMNGRDPASAAALFTDHSVIKHYSTMTQSTETIKGAKGVPFFFNKQFVGLPAGAAFAVVGERDLDGTTVEGLLSIEGGGAACKGSAAVVFQDGMVVRYTSSSNF